MSVPHAPPFDAFLEDLACLGVEPAFSDAPDGHTYGCLKARSNARWWLAPLSDRKATLAGLAMFQPTTSKSKAVKAATSGLVSLGLGSTVLRAHLTLSGLPDVLQARSWPQSMTECAYFTGTDGPHRKTAIQIIGAEGKILGYGKLSRNPQIWPYLAQEADILKRLPLLDLQSANTPQLMFNQAQPDHHLLVTDTLRQSNYSTPRNPGLLHHAFLSELATKTGRTDSDGIFTADMSRLFDRIAPDLNTVWQLRLRRSLEVLRDAAPATLCLCHGDFTPSNCFVTGSGLYVFDWEYALPDGPLGYDLAHFRLSSSGKLETLAPLISELAGNYFHGKNDQARLAVLRYLMRHALFYLERSLLADSTTRTWGERDLRGALLDQLLLHI
jgi:hypothetical protein